MYFRKIVRVPDMDDLRSLSQRMGLMFVDTPYTVRRVRNNQLAEHDKLAADGMGDMVVFHKEMKETARYGHVLYTGCSLRRSTND